MSAKRGASGLSGILLVDKPEGLTSHDVVNRVRRATGEKRVGHAGTLDPMATGLLVVLVGPATRLASFLTAAEKRYVARIVFGSETDTDDAEGRVVREAPIPDAVRDSIEAARIVSSLVGEHEQVPPAYSAIKRDGVTAYQAARKGEALELEARKISIDSAQLVSCDAEAAAWDVALSVSKGTYIRAIARDLGRELESAAHLGALRRTQSGGLGVDAAVTLDEVRAAASPEAVAAHFADPIAALGLPVFSVDADGAASVANGRSIELPADSAVELAEGQRVAVVHDDTVLAVYAVSSGSLVADTVIPGGVKKGLA
ncbi:MAG TPA: tRNA pseudouridine(55) synthase TruB [Coriobacteriia bacterium]|nr:tRNA pseudouridine(55) synthase TruB [Coriobacteriia bacterium]